MRSREDQVPETVGLSAGVLMRYMEELGGDLESCDQGSLFVVLH